MAWLSLDGGDNDAVGFLAALQTIAPSVGVTVLVTLAQQPDLRHAVGDIINDLDAMLVRCARTGAPLTANARSGQGVRTAKNGCTLLAGDNRPLHGANCMMGHQNAAWMTAIIEASSDAIISFTPDGTIISWSLGAAAMFGYDADEAIGQSVTLLTPPDFTAELKRTLAAINQGNPVTQLETIRVRESGDRFPVSVTGSPVRDESGTIVGGVAIVQDISERTRREQHEALLSDVSAALVGLDTIAQTMEQLGVMLGHYFDVQQVLFTEAVNEKAAVLAYGWHAEGAPMVEGTYNVREYMTEQQMEAMYAGDISIVNDTHADPRVNPETYAALGMRAFIIVPLARDKEWLFQLSVTDNRPRMWHVDEVELMRELANRIWTRLERARAEERMRQSEEMYRAIFYSINEGFTLLDVQFDEYGNAEDAIVVDANPTQDRIDGFRAHIGKRVREFLPDFEQRWLERYASIVRSGESQHFQDWSEPSQRWYNVHASRVGGEGSSLIAIVYDDITERTHAEAAVRASEERYRTLFETIDEGFCVLELIATEPVDFRYIAANPAFARYTDVHDIVGKTIREAFPDAPETAYHLYHDVLTTGQPVRFEIEVPTIGRILSVYAFRISESTHERVTVLFNDITQRKRAEIVLRASEERLSFVFDVLPLGIGVYDSMGHMIFSNQEMQQYIPTGKMPSVDEERVWRWRGFHSDGQPFTRLDYPGARALRGERIVPGIDMLYRQDDDQEVWARVTAVPILDEDQHITGLVSVIADIDAVKRFEATLRASETRFRAVANLVPDLLWESDPDGSTVWYNQRWMEYTGQQVEEALGWGWMETIHPDDRVGSAQRYTEAIQSGQSLRQEHRIRRHDGEYRWFAVEAMPLLDQDGGVVKVYGSAADIHEERIALAAEQAARAEAEAALRTRDQFLSIASHELRTPLTSMLGYAALLQASTIDDAPMVPMMAEQIAQQTRRLNSLISQLLDISRLQHGQFTINPQPLDVISVLDRVVASTRMIIPKGGPTLAYTYPHEPVMIDGDAERLEQVFQNLIGNAIKYSPRGSEIAVTISVASSAAIVEVTDHGIGIPQDAQARLFEPFYRAPNVGSLASGFGLGLHIVREVMDRHNGHVELDSIEGQGSTFRVVLPLIDVGNGD